MTEFHISTGTEIPSLSLWEVGKKWEPHELRALPVPHDVGVPIHRSHDLHVVRVSAPFLGGPHQVQHSLQVGYAMYDWSVSHKQ